MIFSSWVLQNAFQADWASERVNLERSQLALDLQQMRLEHWQGILIAELAKSAPDDRVLLDAGFKAVQSQGNLTAWSIGRIVERSEQYDAALASRSALDRRAQQLYQRGDGKAMVLLLDSLIRIGDARNEAPVLTTLFQARYRGVYRSEQVYGRAILLAFIFGSVLVAWGYLRSTGDGENAA